MQIHIFGIDFTKNFFFFLLNNCNIKVVFVIKDFLIWLLKQKVCINMSGNITLNGAEIWGKMSSKKQFLSEKGQVWFGMIEKLLWSAWPLHMKCSFFKVDTIKWLVFFDILIDWLTRAAFLYIMKTKMTIFSSFYHRFCSKLVRSCMLTFPTIVVKQAKL
jgi:hypothetical protein